MNAVSGLLRLRLIWWIDSWMTFALLSGSTYLIWGMQVTKWVLFVGAILSMFTLAVERNYWLPKLEWAAKK